MNECCSLLSKAVIKGIQDNLSELHSSKTTDEQSEIAKDLFLLNLNINFKTEANGLKTLPPVFFLVPSKKNNENSSNTGSASLQDVLDTFGKVEQRPRFENAIFHTNEYKVFLETIQSLKESIKPTNGNETPDSHLCTLEISIDSTTGKDKPYTAKISAFFGLFPGQHVSSCSLDAIEISVDRDKLRNICNYFVGENSTKNNEEWKNNEKIKEYTAMVMYELIPGIFPGLVKLVKDKTSKAKDKTSETKDKTSEVKDKVLEPYFLLFLMAPFYVNNSWGYTYAGLRVKITNQNVKFNKLVTCENCKLYSEYGFGVGTWSKDTSWSAYFYRIGSILASVGTDLLGRVTGANKSACSPSSNNTVFGRWFGGGGKTATGKTSPQSVNYKVNKTIKADELSNNINKQFEHPSSQMATNKAKIKNNDSKTSLGGIFLWTIGAVILLVVVILFIKMRKASS